MIQQATLKLIQTSKVCSKCKEEKDISEFGKGKDTKLGIKSSCKVCIKKSRDKYYLTPNSKVNRNKSNNKKHKANKETLEKIKLEKGCELCGFNKHSAALQFDHIDPYTKSFTISSQYKKHIDILLEEVNKCRILCANCHAIETHKNNHYKVRR